MGYSASEISEVRKSYCESPLIDPKYHITVVTKYINIVTEVRIHNVKTILYPRLSLFFIRIFSMINKLGTSLRAHSLCYSGQSGRNTAGGWRFTSTTFFFLHDSLSRPPRTCGRAWYEICPNPES